MNVTGSFREEGKRKQPTLVLTDRCLQRWETGRREISEGGDALRRAGAKGAVAVRLAVAAIEEQRPCEGEVMGRL